MTKNLAEVFKHVIMNFLSRLTKCVEWIEKKPEGCKEMWYDLVWQSELHFRACNNNFANAAFYDVTVCISYSER